MQKRDISDVIAPSVNDIVLLKVLIFFFTISPLLSVISHIFHHTILIAHILHQIQKCAHFQGLCQLNQIYSIFYGNDNEF